MITKTEYGHLLTGSGFLVFNDSPEFEAVFPMADRVADAQRLGGHVYKRVVVVVDDREEVPA